MPVKWLAAPRRFRVRSESVQNICDIPLRIEQPLFINARAVTMRRLSTALMGRIRGNYRFILGFNLTLIVCGVTGLIQPTLSALLHNASTLGISLRSMTDLLHGENAKHAALPEPRRA